MAEILRTLMYKSNTPRPCVNCCDSFGGGFISEQSKILGAGAYISAVGGGCGDVLGEAQIVPESINKACETSSTLC